MYMSFRASPTICQARSSPSRLYPMASAARHDPSFHGSTYSSKRSISGSDTAHAVSALSAALAYPCLRNCSPIQ
jgi:hypothetical protein